MSNHGRCDGVSEKTASPSSDISFPQLLPRPLSCSQPPLANLEPDNSLTRQGSAATDSSSSVNTTQATPVVPGAGPARGQYAIPDRPKPGRKPAQDEPQSKRRAQNRNSQREFRKRKDCLVKDLTQKVKDAEATINELKAQINNKAPITHMQQQLTMLTKTNLTLIRQHEEDEARIQELLLRLMKYEPEAQHQFTQPLLGSRPTSSHETATQGSSHPSRNLAFNNRQAINASDLGITTPPLDKHATQYMHPSTPGAQFPGSQTNDSPALRCVVCHGLRGSCQCDQASEFNFSAMDQPLLHNAETHPSSDKSEEEEKPKQHMKELKIDVSEREVDFTSLWMKSRVEAKTDTEKSQDLNPSSEFQTETGPCGFCDSANFCPCRDLPPSSTGADEETQKPPAATPPKAPGSCPDCQSNPAQKRWCQRVAQLRAESSPAPARSSRSSSISSTLEPMEPHIPDASSPLSARPSIGCSEAFKLFEGRYPMAQNNMDWIANLKPIIPGEQHPLRKYSALELDTAGVIATLGNTLQPLQPRPADGNYVDLVRMAQSYQRSTQTPGTDVTTHEMDHDPMDLSPDVV